LKEETKVSMSHESSESSSTTRSAIATSTNLSLQQTSGTLFSNTSNGSNDNNTNRMVNEVDSGTEIPSAEYDITKVVRQIGKGAFSRCYLLESNYALKTLPLVPPPAQKSVVVVRDTRSVAKKQKSHTTTLLNEYNIHKQLQHGNIVSCFASEKDQHSMHLVLEYCARGNLQTLIKEGYLQGLNQRKQILSDVLNGLHYLHNEKHILHRDLKIANIFLTDFGVAKIGDFGLSVDVKKLSLMNARDIKLVCGTPNYMAPEIIRRQAYSYPVDVWAFGVIMFCILCNRMPFESTDKKVKSTYQRISNLEYCFTSHELDTLPESAINLIQTIFIQDPLKRPTVNEIRKSDFFYC
jgi:serine/threonine protein kinase